MLQRDRGAQGQGTSLSQGLAQVGHSLRRARVSQGLAIRDAARAAGLTVDDAQALETGDPSRMPDQVHTVNLLRRYAQSLGLPADRYALALLDAWPTAAPRPGPTPRPAANPQPAVTSSVPAPRPPADPEGGSTWVGDQPTGMLQSTNGAPVAGDQDHGTTGVYPAYDPASHAGPAPEESSPGAPTGDTGPTRVTRSTEAPGHGPATVMTPVDTGPVVVSVLDTGSTPAVHTHSTAAPARSRRGGLILLRLTVALMLILVVVGGAALAIHHWRPQWLRSLEHNSTNNPPASTAVTQSGGAASGGSITQDSLSTTGATITVHGTNPKVSVSAVGGPSWVEVRAPGQSNPVFAADIESGNQKTFDVQSSLQIQVGSSAARLAVSVDHSSQHTYAPATAPFTYTFTVN